MLSHKELLYLQDFLAMQQQAVKQIEYLSGMVQEEDTKQFLQELAKVNEDSFATLGSYINSGQKLHMQGV